MGTSGSTCTLITASAARNIYLNIDGPSETLAHGMRFTKLM